MKNKKTSLIVTICLTVAFAIAAVLCFVIPMLSQSKKDAPVEVTQTIKLEYKSVDGVRAYHLVGKIRNKSDSTVKFKDYGGLTVYFTNSDDVANEWLGVDEITLEPGEEFDLAEGTYYFQSSGVSVSKVSIKIDGTTYYLVGRQGGGIASILGFIFIILAVTMLIVTIATARQNKTGAVRTEALNAVCNQLGGDSFVITASVNNKDESKKAAAKTAGWAVAGAVTSIFTGVGYYKVYSGTALKEFIINKNSLYMLKEGDVTADNLLRISADNFAVDSITVKKKNVIMKSADKKRTFKFLTDKKTPVSPEQIAEYLNNIFVNKTAVIADECAPTYDAVSADDPFTDLQPDVAATEAVAAKSDEQQPALDENTDNE